MQEITGKVGSVLFPMHISLEEKLYLSFSFLSCFSVTAGRNTECEEKKKKIFHDETIQVGPGSLRSLYKHQTTTCAYTIQDCFPPPQGCNHLEIQSF